MNHCIYDRNDECTHDCEGCPSQFVRCSCCGCDSGEFFRLGDEILCLDCMIEENGEELFDSVDDDDELDRVYEYYQQIMEAEEEKE